MERIFLLDLCSSRWRPPACSRMTLPVPVRRKRFFAPLCVFIFGMGADLLRVAYAGGRTWSVGPGGSRLPCAPASRSLGGGGLLGRDLLDLVDVVVLVGLVVLVRVLDRAAVRGLT